MLSYRNLLKSWNLAGSICFCKIFQIMKNLGPDKPAAQACQCLCLSHSTYRCPHFLLNKLRTLECSLYHFIYHIWYWSLNVTYLRYFCFEQPDPWSVKVFDWVLTECWASLFFVFFVCMEKAVFLWILSGFMQYLIFTVIAQRDISVTAAHISHSRETWPYLI